MEITSYVSYVQYCTGYIMHSTNMSQCNTCNGLNSNEILFFTCSSLIWGSSPYWQHYVKKPGMCTKFYNDVNSLNIKYTYKFQVYLPVTYWYLRYNSIILLLSIYFQTQSSLWVAWLHLFDGGCGFVGEWSRRAGTEWPGCGLVLWNSENPFQFVSCQK